MTLLAGCATSSDLGSPKLKVQITDNCAPLADPAAPPAPDPKEDPRFTAEKLAAWGASNANRQRKYAACQERVRKKYSTGG